MGLSDEGRGSLDDGTGLLGGSWVSGVEGVEELLKHIFAGSSDANLLRLLLCAKWECER